MTNSRLAIIAIALCAMTACGSQPARPTPPPAEKPEPKPAKPPADETGIDLGSCKEKIPVSGAPCLDALTLHMCAVGCKKMVVRGDTLDGPLFFTCDEPVQAPYNQSFIAVPAPNVIQHPDVVPWCVDATMFMATGDLQYPSSGK